MNIIITSAFYLYLKIQASVCSVLMIFISQHTPRITQKDENLRKHIFPKNTKEDFGLQTAHLGMSSDAVAILDASQTY